MASTSAQQLDDLLKKFEEHPNDLDLINAIAIGYFENYAKKKDKEDYDFFEKAYLLEKTVKSTHNFAWFLYFEWSEIEWRWNEDLAIPKALSIQKECLELNPKSFYPYYQYGYMLMADGDYKEAIPYLRQAMRIENRRDIEHNLACSYFQLGDYDIAKIYFSNAAKRFDLENRSLFNLALTLFKLGQYNQLQEIADDLFEMIERNVHKTVSGYEVAILYFLIEDYSKATAATLKQGVSGICLFDWPALSFVLAQTDKDLWLEIIQDEITDRKKWLDEIQNNHEDWEDLSTEEKQTRSEEFRVEIASREKAIQTGMGKPQLDINHYLRIEYCSCLLFDCKRHKNKADDQ
ncbi:MAG: tetratricopeptide repeat protein [Aureispira sp.]|nr:tetratricopeptide repeat protein [Aureispira sp.]